METLEHTQHEKETNQIIEQLAAPRPVVIGIEGGPCGGKTTLIEKIMTLAGDRPVVCVPEAASQHILELADRGIEFSELEFGNRPMYLETEAKILRSIVDNIDKAVADAAGSDTIILADRCDIAAYVEPDEYAALLESIGLTESPIYSRVDQLYYLPSVSRIDQTKYEELKLTNPARFETAERAAEICCRIQQAVADHPELHIGWGTDFDATVESLSQAIVHPDQETELKIHASDAQVQSLLKEAVPLSTHEITQSYHTCENQLFRLRKTITDTGKVKHYFTLKTGERLTRRELQRQIDDHMYKQLYAAQLVGAPLTKQRHHVLSTFADNTMRSWYVDRYYDRRLPEWNIETDIADDAEAARLLEQMQGFEQASYGAEQLARRLGTYALR